MRQQIIITIRKSTDVVRVSKTEIGEELDWAEEEPH